MDTRAEDAQQLIESPIYKRAMIDLEETIVSQLKTVSLQDKAMKEKLINLLQLVGALDNTIQSYVNTGVIELHNEQQKKAFWQRKKKRI